ncbi:hypothetical protein NX059_006817 [Plenodomus lindquistii]|nr:hypothetical protein NX059_006817 [Plenodomus lindquistii]
MRGFIPTRLIHVSTDTPHDRPRLYEMDTESLQKPCEVIEYIALSHCWGKKAMKKTTKSNRQEHLTTGIEWESLSKTFQELMILARRLGISYVWIDALCIIQDDIDDWAHEASRMCDVYSNATLTIGASNSQDGSEGLIHRRPVLVASCTNNRANVDIHLRQNLDHLLRLDILHEPLEISLTTRSSILLRQRAWCLQEEILSPRFVHFTEHEVVYTCRKGTMCQCSPQWVPSENARLLDLAKGLVISIEGFRHSWQYTWINLIQDYTSRQMTNGKDKLPAISSLASIFEENGGRYYAGMWETDLPACLLWSVEEGSRSTSCDTISSPPSWSWASIKGSVRQEFVSSWPRHEVEVLDVGVYPSTADLRGMVSGGHITLQGVISSLTWKRPKFVRKQKFSDCKIRVDEQTSVTGRWCFVPDFVDVLSDKASVYENEHLVLAISSIEGHSFPDGRRIDYVYGLVLEPLERPSETQLEHMNEFGSNQAFLRVGMADLKIDSAAWKSMRENAKTQIVTIF